MNLWDAIKTGISVSNPLGAIATLGSSIISGIGNNAAQKSANQANLDIAKQNNETSIAIADANRQAQIDMMRENNQFSRQQAIEMFNLENAYNSPVEQVKRLKEAGINPAVFFGQGAGSAGSGDIATPSAAGSTISGSLPTLTTPHLEAAPPIVSGSIQAMAQLINMSLAAAQAEKTGAETSKLQLMMGEEFNNLVLQNKNLEIKNNAEQFQYQMEQLFAQTERGTRLAKVVQEIYDLGADIQLKAAQGKLADAHAALADMEKEFTNSRNTELKLKMAYVVPLLKAQINLLGAQAQEQRASAQSHLANARLTNEQASQLEDMHDFIVSIKRNEADISDKNAIVKFHTYLDEINKIQNESKMSQAELDEQTELVRKARAAADKAEKENSAFYWQMALDTFGDLVQGAATIYGLKFLGKGIGKKYSEPKLDKGSNTYQRYHPENGLYY